MKRAALMLTLFLLPFSATARADVLLLKSGGRVEGIVTEVSGGYLVETIHGKAIVRKEKVAGRVEAPYLTEIYEQKRAAIEASDPDAQFRLSLWCEGMGLARRARHHVEETLLLDPDHARARAKLGYERFRGVWMSPEDAREAAMAAEGFVRFEGRWLTERGLAAYLEARLELARLEEAVARAAAEREKAELEAKLAAEELAKKEAERKALEQVLARAEEDRKERDRMQRDLDRLRDLVRDLTYRGSVGFGGYGTSLPAAYLPSYGTRQLCGGYRRSLSPGLSFEWNRGNLRVRGRIR